MKSNDTGFLILTLSFLLFTLTFMNTFVLTPKLIEQQENKND